MTSASDNRRNLMLEEMGIAPRWHARAAAAPTLAGAASNAQAEAATIATAVAVPAAAVPIAEGTQGTDSRRATIMNMGWDELKADVAACTHCVLCKRRNNTVFGVGDEQANWMFIGEGPGADEDAQGEPFVGQAGKLLDSMLAAIALARGANVYITNVVKCRPPGNRNPEPAESLACEPYLHRQIELIKPRLIVALGKVAAVNLLAKEASVASMRNKVHRYRDIPLIVTYHPAYLLRSLLEKARAWEDLCFAVDTMAALSANAADAATA